MATREEIATLLRNGVAARRQGQLAEALPLMNQALALCGPDQDLERALILRELGELARNSNDLPAAQRHYEEGVALLRKSNADPLKLAHTLRHLGDVHAEQRHSNEADHYFSQALAIYRQHPTPGRLDLANAIRAHAALKTATGQHEAARPMWAEAGALYEAEGIAAGEKECRRHSL